MICVERPRVVFDCNIYLQGTVSGTGPAFACLEAFDQGDIELYISDSIRDEIAYTLSRPALQKRFLRLTQEQVNLLLRRLDEKAIFVINVPEEFRYQRDPDDERYVNLAIVTQANYLVTRDNDLLDLMDETRRAGREFRHQYPFLRIINPAAFLTEISSETEGKPLPK